jgi:transposase-like protein
MPAERTTMRQVREVLRLKFVGGVPTREIARRIGVTPSTVRTTIRPFQAAGLSWPLPDEMTDATLEARLFSEAGTEAGPPAAGRARLGEHPSRAQAQARHPVDPLGRLHCAQSAGIPLVPLLRAVPDLGRQALRHDAPDPRRR